MRADCARNGSNGNMARRWKHAAAVRVSGLQATTSNLPLPSHNVIRDRREGVCYLFFLSPPHRSPPSKSFRSIVGMACTSVAAAAGGHRPMRRSRRRRRRRLFTRHTTRNVNVCVCVCVSARACVGIRLRGIRPPNPPRRRRLLRVSVMRQCKPSAKGSRRRRVVGVSPMGGRPKPDDGGDRGAHRGSRRCR